MTIDANPHEVYAKCFADPAYKMGPDRKTRLIRFLEEIPLDDRDTHCDVGTGRGEAIVLGWRFGYRSCGWDLPTVIPFALDNVRDWIDPMIDITKLPIFPKARLVTCLDVLEHVPEAKAHAAIDALFSKVDPGGKLLTSIAHFRDGFGKKLGIGELHINRKNTQWWVENMTNWLGIVPSIWYEDTSPGQCWLVTDKPL